ncbi:hypothetical protein KIPB_009879, partial [Kipferlia bialata]|eukprot:g9879.t1
MYDVSSWLVVYDETAEHGTIPGNMTTIAVLDDSLYDPDTGLILDAAAQATLDANILQYYTDSSLPLPSDPSAPFGIMAQFPDEVLERVGVDEGTTDQRELFPQFFQQDPEMDWEALDGEIQYQQKRNSTISLPGTEFDQTAVWETKTWLQSEYPFVTLTIPEGQGLTSDEYTPEIQTFLPPSFDPAGPYYRARRK